MLPPLPVSVTAAQLVVSRIVEPPANVPPGQVEPPSDWVYRIVVKNIQLPLPTDLTEYPGTVTVQVVSGASRTSELPAPAYVVRRAYGAPPPLTELATSEFVTATRPDFEGRIGVPLSWPKMAGITHFNVYRVEVPKLLDTRGASLQLAQDLFENETNRAQVKLLGGQLASISAFTLITPVPIAPETDPDAPTRHRWTDRIAAPRDQSYVYRIQPLSAAGNEALWPTDSGNNNENRNRCILVLQKNRDPLLPPAIYELEPLDRSIGVVVRNPLSETVNGLRIYKTSQPSQVNDVRAMTLIHGTISFTHERIQLLPANNGTPARVKFVDEKVQVGTQYFYRVIFVDELGNFSQASEPMAATPRSFAPPAPPTLSATRIAPDTINLAWQADHNEGQVKLQRKRSGEGQWIDLTPDFVAPTDSFVDNSAVGITRSPCSLTRRQRARGFFQHGYYRGLTNMGFWDWLADRIDHFFHDPTDNVNNGLIANPFLVKQTPDPNHYHVGNEFGQIQGTVQRTSTEFWASSEVSLVHVGIKPPEQSLPSFTLAAIINGLLRLVPEGQTAVIPRSDRHPFGKITVNGPAYILESLDTAVDSFKEKLNGDVWIEAGLCLFYPSRTRSRRL